MKTEIYKKKRGLNAPKKSERGSTFEKIISGLNATQKEPINLFKNKIKVEFSS